MDAFFYEIMDAVHEKNKHHADEKYGTKIAKKLRKLFRRSWRGVAKPGEGAAITKMAAEALRAKGEA